MVKFCDKCGSELKNENAKFCDKCGVELKFASNEHNKFNIPNIQFKLKKKVWH